MPMAPPRLCPACRGRITAGSCPTCRKRRDTARGTAQQRGYTRAWADYSHTWLQRFPWCGQRQDGRFYAEHSRCVQHGLRTKARCTDHIRALRDGGSVLDPANHQSLCISCNVAKAMTSVHTPQ